MTQLSNPESENIELFQEWLGYHSTQIFISPLKTLSFFFNNCFYCYNFKTDWMSDYTRGSVWGFLNLNYVIQLEPLSSVNVSTINCVRAFFFPQ